MVGITSAAEQLSATISNLVSSFRLKHENKLATYEWGLTFHGDKCTVWSPYLPPTAVFKFPILLLTIGTNK